MIKFISNFILMKVDRFQNSGKLSKKTVKREKRRIQDTESLNWKKIEGEIVFSIANIFIGRKTQSAKQQEPKSIICVAKEILVKDIIKDEKSYFSYVTDEEDDDEVSE